MVFRSSEDVTSVSDGSGKQPSIFVFISTAATTHEQNIICSKTHLDGITHKQTIICKQSFPGHMVCPRHIFNTT